MMEWRRGVLKTLTQISPFSPSIAPETDSFIPGWGCGGGEKQSCNLKG